MKITSYVEGPNYKKILHHSISCDTKNVIYLISCKVCSAQYVGQTTTALRTRFNNHRYSVQRNLCTPVGQHFNSSGHNGTTDMWLQGIEIVQNPSKQKLNQRESTWIWNLGSHQILSGLNIDEPHFSDLKFTT